jgi:hypothetical protein
MTFTPETLNAASNNWSVLLRPIFVLTIITLSNAAEAPKRQTVGEQLPSAVREFDAKPLRGLSTLKIGSVRSTKSLSEDEARKVVFDTLRSHNVPVEWTPTTSSYSEDAPTLWLLTSISREGCAKKGGAVHSSFRLTLHENIVLAHAKLVESNLPVWSVQEDADFEPEANKDEMVSVLKKLTERFSLSYLAANR